MGIETLRKVVKSPVDGVNLSTAQNLIKDTEWGDCLNVRFLEDAIEKVEGKYQFNWHLPEHARLIELYYKKDNMFWLIASTNNGFYTYFPNMKIGEIDINDSDTLQTETIFDMFVVCSNNIQGLLYWDGYMDQVSLVPGTFNPPYWSPNKEYSEGDFIQPTHNNNANKVIFMATNSGWSGSTEPVWPLLGDVSDTTPTGKVKVIWRLVGGLGIEGTTNNVFSCSCMRSFQGFLVCGNTQEGGFNEPFRIRWCQWGNLYKWRNDPDTGFGQAGYFDLDNDVSWVQQIKPLKDYLVIYKERAVSIMKYVGGDTIWSLRHFVIGNGLLSPGAIVDLDEEHIFIGPSGIYSFNLTSIREVGQNISKWFFDIAHGDYLTRITSFYVEEVPEMWFCFVSVNNKWLQPDENNNFPELPSDKDMPPYDMALVMNAQTEKWSIRTIDSTAFGYYFLEEGRTIDEVNEPIESQETRFDSARSAQNMPVNICCDIYGQFYNILGTGYIGEDYEGFIQTKLFDFDKPEIIKRIKRILVSTARYGGSNLLVHVGASQAPDNKPVWYGPYSVDLSENALPWVDVDISGRYLSIRFSTIHKGEPFKITDYTIFYQERGDI